MASYLDFDSTSAAVRLRPIVDGPALVLLSTAQQAVFLSYPPHSMKVTSYLDLYGTCAAVRLRPIVDGPALVLLSTAQRARTCVRKALVACEAHLVEHVAAAQQHLGGVRMCGECGKCETLTPSQTCVQLWLDLEQLPADRAILHRAPAGACNLIPVSNTSPHLFTPVARP